MRSTWLLPLLLLTTAAGGSQLDPCSSGKAASGVTAAPVAVMSPAEVAALRGADPAVVVLDVNPPEIYDADLAAIADGGPARHRGAPPGRVESGTHGRAGGGRRRRPDRARDRATSSWPASPLAWSPASAWRGSPTAASGGGGRGSWRRPSPRSPRAWAACRWARPGWRSPSRRSSHVDRDPRPAPGAGRLSGRARGRG